MLLDYTEGAIREEGGCCSIVNIRDY